MMRPEYTHTLPEHLIILDLFVRVDDLFGCGLDNAMGLSVPWGVDPIVGIHGRERRVGRSAVAGRVELKLGRFCAS